MVYSGFARIIVLADSQDFVDVISQIYSSSRKRVRNKAAKLNGNAIKIIDTKLTGDPFLGGGVTYMVEVYNCDFEKVKN